MKDEYNALEKGQVPHPHSVEDDGEKSDGHGEKASVPSLNNV